MVLQGHIDSISDLAFSTAGDLLVSANEDKAVGLWSLSTGDSLIVLECDIDKMTIITFSPNGQYVASNSAKRTVRIWDCASGKPLHILDGHILSVTWMENQLELYTVDAKKLVHVWRLVKRDDGGIQVQLILRPKSGGLWTSGAKFNGVNDLSTVNRILLRQRRAFLE
ncbi:hypothetical protein EC957_005658 [Mortierella hygrophila]|uniref:Uncharacterized protein n=1 Tax=Mortierella hygrophila TaxID=979708 RepID=A0A9P6K6L3_9FUNG|nr:hypothetical protein EC957_005658 [Mortierella hygrophila]